MYILITLVVDLAKRALSRVDEDFTQPEKIRTLCVKTLGFEKVRLCIESSVNFDLQLIHRLYHKPVYLSKINFILISKKICTLS